MLTGIPSIIIGIFAYTLMVLPMRSFSALAGAFALAIIMIPTVTRTTEEMLKLVPGSLREASLALGVPMWKTVLRVVVPGRHGRASSPARCWPWPGREARPRPCCSPPSATASGPWILDKPIAALPLQIFTYAISPYDDWRAQAWAGAFVLVAMVLIISLVARFFTRGARTMR